MFIILLFLSFSFLQILKLKLKLLNKNSKTMGCGNTTSKNTEEPVKKSTRHGTRGTREKTGTHGKGGNGLTTEVVFRN